MVIEPAGVPQAASLKKPVVAEVEESETAVAPPRLAGLPNASCDCTVASALHAPAARFCGAVMMTSLLAAAALMASVCEVLARPAVEAVTSAAPARVSL